MSAGNGKTKEGKTFFYIASSRPRYLFKIGVTSNLKERLAKLITASGSDVRYEWTATRDVVAKAFRDEIGTPEGLERYLLERFSSARAEGEWIHETKAVIACIGGMISILAKAEAALFYGLSEQSKTRGLMKQGEFRERERSCAEEAPLGDFPIIHPRLPFPRSEEKPN